MAYDSPSPDEGGAASTLMDPAFLRSPQLFYPALRAHGVIDASPMGLILSRRSDVISLLGQPEIFSSGVGVTETGAQRPLIPLQLDPPEHRRYRKILDPIFTRQRMAEMEAPISQLAGELIDGIAAGDETDFVKQFSISFPSQVFLTLLGLPFDELPRFLLLKDGFIRPESLTGKPRDHEDSKQLLAETAAAVYAYFEEVIGERRSAPGDDLVSRFLETEVEGERLSHEDILDICFLFLVAGLDTVSASLDCLMMHLASHPERRQALVDDPGLIPNAVEELLRWESPVIMVGRIATKDAELGGCPVKKGQHVIGLIGSANTDEEGMADAELVRFDREVNRHLAYGRGIHRCLGANLAQVELTVALREWHQRIPDYQVAPGFEPAFTSSIRSLTTLPLLLGHRG
jgi:cytochrome P450